MVHVSVGSPAGTYNVASKPFFRYVVRLCEIGLPLTPAEQEAIEVLGEIPDAFLEDEYIAAGAGWRVIPPSSLEDWSVLEATPQRLRTALLTARGVLWRHAAPAGISAREITLVDDEIEKVLAVLARAEEGGFSVNVVYVS